MPCRACLKRGRGRIELRTRDLAERLGTRQLVPAGEIFGESTKNTPHAMLSRYRAKLRNKVGPETVVEVPCYRMPPGQQPPPDECYRLQAAYSTLAASSGAMVPKDTLAKIWPRGGSDGDVWSLVYDLKARGLIIESTNALLQCSTHAVCRAIR
jgi:hypothetical protein